MVLFSEAITVFSWIESKHPILTFTKSGFIMLLRSTLDNKIPRFPCALLLMSLKQSYNFLQCLPMWIFQIEQLEIEKIVSPRSFIWIWCGSGEGLDAARRVSDFLSDFVRLCPSCDYLICSCLIHFE